MNTQTEALPHEEKLTVQVAARVKKTTKQKLKELSEKEGKRMSDTVREILDSFIED